MWLEFMVAAGVDARLVRPSDWDTVVRLIELPWESYIKRIVDQWPQDMKDTWNREHPKP